MWAEPPPKVVLPRIAWVHPMEQVHKAGPHQERMGPCGRFKQLVTSCGEMSATWRGCVAGKCTKSCVSGRCEVAWWGVNTTQCICSGAGGVVLSYVGGGFCPTRKWV